MISILDIILIFILAAVLFVISIGAIIFPITGLERNMTGYLNSFIDNIQGNYYMILVGILLLLISIKLLFTIFKRNRTISSNYITKWSNFGEIKISSETIIGITNSVIVKFVELRESKVSVSIEEGKLYLKINGQTSPDINIPAIVEDLQEKIKIQIEESTGIEVSEINIYIENVVQPNRSLR